MLGPPLREIAPDSLWSVFENCLPSLQLADLTGELMRLAIGRISDGELEYAEKICKFVREIHRELTLVVPLMDDSHDMKIKMEIMLQSVMKIENGNMMLGLM